MNARIHGEPLEKRRTFFLYEETGQPEPVPYVVDEPDAEPEVYVLRNTEYGFYDSKEIEDEEGSHWEHYISNLAEFRNIVNKKGVKDTLDTYPGDGDPKTVYIITSDLDFDNQPVWSVSDGIKNFVFQGTLKGANEDPESRVTIRNFNITEPLSTKLGSDGGLFDRAKNANFENLVFDNCHVYISDGKGVGIIAAGTESVYCEYFHFKNVETNSNCSVYGQRNCGGFIGYARDTYKVTFEDCQNGAKVTAAGTSGIAGGFVGTGAVEGTVIDEVGTTEESKPSRDFSFVRCNNTGTITSGNYAAGFLGYCFGDPLNKIKNKIIITDCANSGNVVCDYGYYVGIIHGRYANITDMEVNGFTNTGKLYCLSAQKTNIVNNNPEFKGGSFSSVPLLYGNDSFINVPEEGTLAKSEFTEATIVVLPTIESLSVTVNHDTHKLDIVNTSGVDYDEVMITATATQAAKVHYSTAEAYGNESGDMVLFSKIYDSIENIDFKEITRLGYFKPSVNYGTIVSYEDKTKANPYDYDFLHFQIDYAHHGQSGYEAGYHSDSDGGYFIADATGTTDDEMFKTFIAFRQEIKYSVYLYNGGVKVAQAEIYAGYYQNGNDTPIPRYGD